MRKSLTLIMASAIAFLCVEMYSQGKPAAKSAPASTSAPASQATSSAAMKVSPKAKWIKPEKFAICRKLAENRAEKAKGFTPSLRLIETPHFLIYTAMEKQTDTELSDMCEQNYAFMCSALNVDPQDAFWNVGKLPIYYFSKPSQMTQFLKLMGEESTRLFYYYSDMNEKWLVAADPADDEKHKWETSASVMENVSYAISSLFLHNYSGRRDMPDWAYAGMTTRAVAASILAPEISNDVNNITRKFQVGAYSKKDLLAAFENLDSEKENYYANYWIISAFFDYMFGRDSEKIKSGQLEKLADAARSGKNYKQAIQAAYGLSLDELGDQWIKSLPSGNKITKSTPFTSRQAEGLRKLAIDWGDKFKKITPKAHMVESQHFLIFTTWDKKDDDGVYSVLEKAYQALSSQFGVPQNEPFFIGKMPVYLAWEKAEFQAFQKLVDKSDMDDWAAGYQSTTRNGMTYVVMGPVKTELGGGKIDVRSTRTWFLEMMVHEFSHAFIKRYKSNIGVPSWINEGVADIMASTLVKGTYAEIRYVNASQEYVDGSMNLDNVKSAMTNFGGWDKTKPQKSDDEINFDYGICQSIVRFLIARDPEKTKLIKLVDLIKSGKSDADALKESYGWTIDEMLAQWTKACKVALKK